MNLSVAGRARRIFLKIHGDGDAKFARAAQNRVVPASQIPSPWGMRTMGKSRAGRWHILEAVGQGNQLLARLSDFFFMSRSTRRVLLLAAQRAIGSQ